MRQDSRWHKGLGGVVVLSIGLAAVSFAQDKPVSDAQVEANVLKVAGQRTRTSRPGDWFLDCLWHGDSERFG